MSGVLAVLLLALAVLGSGVLTGCKTLQFADDRSLASAKGWVVISPYDFADLTVHRMAGGVEGAALRVSAGMMAPVANA